MVDTWKNAGLAVTTSYTTAYTCPSATQVVVLGLQVANVDGVNSATGVGLRWYDSSATTAFTLLMGATIPAGQALDVLGGQQLTLEVGDYIEAICDAASDAELSVSVIEVT